MLAALVPARRGGDVDLMTALRRERRNRMIGLASDLRYALRSLARRPGLAVAAIVTLALGSAPTSRSSPSWTA
jgi:hypothetical protein